jgi:hypothetical protein
VTVVWRVFPWDAGAPAGEVFSRQYLPRQSGQGRFDLPLGGPGSAWYFAGTPEHAVGEKIQDLRIRVLNDEFLFERGRRLALCTVEYDGPGVADLCDAGELVKRRIAPDRLAYRDRDMTRSIVRDLRRGDPDLAGFRWWSALLGEWHTTVLFSDRLAEGSLSFGDPEPLDLDSPAVVSAADWLGIEIGR